jgi:hypothetical protein
MKNAWLLAAAAPALLLAGCLKGPAKLDTKDPDYYAQKIKRQVYELVQAAWQDPKAAGPQGSVLLEELEGYKTQPVGDHEATYEQLLQKCRELVEAANRRASQAQIRKTLGEMKALADKLPGTVILEKPDE